MAIISCPECGRSVSDRAISCPECGYPISADPGVTTQQAEADKLSKLLVLAHRAREGSDSKNAKKYYDQILDMDPGNWEGIFYSVYFEASQCTIRDIGAAANAIANSIFSTFSAIADLNDENEKNVALRTVIKSCYAIGDMFVSSACNHYSQFYTTTGAYGECSGRVVAAGNMYSEIEQTLKRLFAKKTKILLDHQQEYLSYLRRHSRWYNDTYRGTVCSRLEREITNARNVAETRKKMEAERARKAAIEQRQREMQEMQERQAAYWQEHAEEKAELESRKEELQAQLAQKNSELEQLDKKNRVEVDRLNKEKANKLPSEIAVDEQNKRISELLSQHEKLGLFKGKEKKAIMDQLNGEEYPKLATLKKTAEAERKQFNAQITTQIGQIAAGCGGLRQDIRELNNSIKQIDDELTKPR